MLAADEAAIAHRKTAIQNFGSYWIRPPGISKTLQAMNEEALEAAEQEEMMRQEQGLRDMQAQQQADELREQAAQNAEQEEEEAGEERDLDDEIPDADADGEVETSAVEAADVTFNEDSMVEGSRFVEDDEVDQEQYAVMEEAELTGAARDEEDLGMEPERNLDDSIPEAGSYQHTDTEVEDSSSESELDGSFAVQSARRSTRQSARLPPQAPPASALHGGLQGGLQERIRSQTAGGEGLARSPGSLNLSSSLLESSFVGSSPVMQRASQPSGRGRGGGRRRGRES